MKQDLLITFTSSIQFGIFGGIALIIFGWIEKNDLFTEIGRFIFIALGIYALWVIFSGQIQVPENTGGVISKEMQALAVFKGVAVCSGIALLSFILKLVKFRYYRLVTLIFLVFALFLFFTVYNIQQN
jgi:hypothetical protein